MLTLEYFKCLLQGTEVHMPLSMFIHFLGPLASVLPFSDLFHKNNSHYRELLHRIFLVPDRIELSRW